MLSNKNDYDNFEHLKLSIEKPRGQLLCYIQYADRKYMMVVTLGRVDMASQLMYPQMDW